MNVFPFRQILLNWRHEGRGISRHHVSRIARVSASMVAAWERGEATPTRQELQRLRGASPKFRYVSLDSLVYRSAQERDHADDTLYGGATAACDTGSFDSPNQPTPPPVLAIQPTDEVLSMSEPTEEFKDALTRLRSANKDSYAALSATLTATNKLGTSRAAIWRWENGQPIRRDQYEQLLVLYPELKNAKPPQFHDRSPAVEGAGSKKSPSTNPGEVSPVEPSEKDATMKNNSTSSTHNKPANPAMLVEQLGTATGYLIGSKLIMEAGEKRGFGRAAVAKALRSAGYRPVRLGDGRSKSPWAWACWGRMAQERRNAVCERDRKLLAAGGERRTLRRGSAKRDSLTTAKQGSAKQGSAKQGASTTANLDDAVTLAAAWSEALQRVAQHRQALANAENEARQLAARIVAASAGTVG